MANKTIDRRKAAPARSQAAKASPKNASAKATRPSETNAGKPSDAKPEKLARAGAEVLDVDEVETDELVTDEEAEIDEDVVDEVDEVDEEEEVEEDEVEESKPARSDSAKPGKARKERDLVVSSQDYSVSRSGRSRIPNFPGSQFLLSSYRELKLVTWPSRRETWHWSLVVLVVCAAVAILLGAADILLSHFVTWWVSLAH